MIDNSDYGVSKLRQSNTYAISYYYRMKESKVLIVNLNSLCTEVARHLVLSGINIELLDI